MALPDVPPLLPPDWLQKHDVERIVARLVKLDVPARTIHFETGGSLTYDTALLATGGVPKIPDIPGCELGGVHVLRSLDDASALIDALGENDSANEHAQVVILGSSFIGLETASALRKRDVTVTVISPEKIPFAKRFGERVGTMFRELHEQNGVVFHLDAKVRSLEGEEGNVHEVMLESGEHVAAEDRKSTRLNSSHDELSRMPSSA